VFGTFLTWLSEKTAPVFVVATANDISQLPPELLRKGRLDEIFYVDLPSREERGRFSASISQRQRAAPDETPRERGAAGQRRGESMRLPRTGRIVEGCRLKVANWRAREQRPATCILHPASRIPHRASLS
jgi:hypothetical protein